MRWAGLLFVAGCVAPDFEPPVVEPAQTDVGLARITDGDSLSGIADRLSFPGGWRALAAYNHIDGDFIRAGRALRVPLDYLRAAGLDPHDLGLIVLPARPEPRRLVHCRAEEAVGDSIALGDYEAALEPTAPPAAGDLDADRGAVDPDSPGLAVAIARGGQRIATIEVPNNWVGGPRELHGYLVDLDGDGRAELVLAVPLLEWGHEGFTLARLIVVGERSERRAGGRVGPTGERGATQMSVEQWEPAALVEGDGRRCDVLATSWDDIDHPTDGWGTYLVGRTFRLERGELVARPEIVMRRMRTMFHYADDFDPVDALAAGEWWPELGTGVEDLAERVDVTRHARIVEVMTLRTGVALRVELDGGQTVWLDPRVVEEFELAGWQPPAGVLPLTQIGAADTSVLYPEGYVPADPSRWLGAEVIVDEVWSRDELADHDGDPWWARHRFAWIP